MYSNLCAWNNKNINFIMQEIMAEAAKVPNVVKITNRAGLYEQLEDIQKRYNEHTITMNIILCL